MYYFLTGFENFFDRLTENSCKTYFTSSDDETSSQALCFQTRVFNASYDIIKINGETSNDLFLSIRNVLTRIRKDILKESDMEFESGSLSRLDKQIKHHRRLTKNTPIACSTNFLLKYILLLNGSSFSKILKDSYLFNHFIFLLHFSHSTLIFDMTVLQKSRFAKLISKKFGIDKLMVIGSGYDILALRKYTSLLINIYPPKNKGSLLVLDGDLICTDFDVLNSFLFVDCFIYSMKLNKIILYIFYSSFILGNYEKFNKIY